MDGTNQNWFTSLSTLMRTNPTFPMRLLVRCRKITRHSTGYLNDDFAHERADYPTNSFVTFAILNKEDDVLTWDFCDDNKNLTETCRITVDINNPEDVLGYTRYDFDGPETDVIVITACQPIESIPNIVTITAFSNTDCSFLFIAEAASVEEARSIVKILRHEKLDTTKQGVPFDLFTISGENIHIAL